MLHANALDGSTAFARVAFVGSTYWVAYDGDLGLITDTSPQGSAGSPGLEGGVFNDAYVPGSHELTGGFNASINQWNTSTDEIRSIRLECGHFQFQSQYDATVGGDKIPKANTQIMNMNWKISWDRKP
jgi:hypothetical protein